MYKGKKVLVVGLGRFGGGVGVIKYLAAKGAKLRITDLKDEKELSSSLEKIKDIPAEYVFGRHRLQDIEWAEVIVFNPAVPPHSPFFQAALKSGKKLETEINLLFQVTPARIIGISGTNGKATVSGLITEMLRQKYGREKVLLGGNMGISLLDKGEKLTANHIIVLELSSFQLNRLAWTKKSPSVSILTNITPDHLEWHLSFEKYQQDKLNLFRYQTKDDLAIVNLYDPVSSKLLTNWPFSSRAVYLGSQETKILNPTTFLIQGEKFSLPEHRLIGQHNLINLLQASLTARLLGVSFSQIAAGIQQFRPPEHALEYVAKIKGVTFINDSEASNQDAAIKGLLSFPKKKIILIAGGYDKGVDLSEFAKLINQRVKFTFLIGQTADKLSSLLEREDYHYHRKIKTLEEAVKLAAEKAQEGDYVLLSPAASSYDMFKNLEERGSLFKRYVHQLAR